jgi:peptidoglycan hydrolase-like protein with peptidoglycan-binding domain
MNMEGEMRRFLLGAASAMALGVAGFGATNAANVDDTPTGPRSNKAGLGALQSSQTVGIVSKDQIRTAQQQLQANGVYHGPIDGLLDAQTRAALSRYQRENGLSETATLDKATMQSLPESTGVAGSSTPRSSSHVTPKTNPNSAGSRAPESSTSPY